MMYRKFSVRGSNRVFGGAGIVVVGILAMFSTTSAYAGCRFSTDKGTTKALRFTIPSSLTVPNNAPVGSIVWEGRQQTVTNPGNDYICDLAYKWGLVNRVGVSASASTPTDMPIGTTGLAWGVTRVLDQRTYVLEDLAVGGINAEAGPYAWLASTWRLTIKKIGSVTAGASVPAGLLGSVNVNNEIDPFTMSTSNKASVSTLSCKTPDVVVRMGDRYRVGQFKGVGTSLAPVNFSIDLKECPEGINKVSYLLKPNTQIVDAAQAVVALDAGSVAKGVGLQVLNQNGKPVRLNEKVVFSEYAKVGGNFSIPFKAAYRQTAPVVEAGSANSSLTFAMSYE